MGKISYECSDKIERLKKDLRRYGAKRTVDVIFKNLNGIEIAADYELSYTAEEKERMAITQEREGKLNERRSTMKISDALLIFAEQDSILDDSAWICDLIDEFSKNIKMNAIFQEVGASQSNYYAFKREGTSMSIQKAIAVYRKLMDFPY